MHICYHCSFAMIIFVFICGKETKVEKIQIKLIFFLSYFFLSSCEHHTFNIESFHGNLLHFMRIKKKKENRLIFFNCESYISMLFDGFSYIFHCIFFVVFFFITFYFVIVFKCLVLCCSNKIIVDFCVKNMVCFLFRCSVCDDNLVLI